MAAPQMRGGAERRTHQLNALRAADAHNNSVKMDVLAVPCSTCDVVVCATQHMDDTTTVCDDAKLTSTSPALPMHLASPDKLALLQPAVMPLAYNDKHAQEDTTQLATQQHQQQPHEKSNVTVHFGPITKQNVELLRQLNLAIFPVRYNDAFYADILRTSREYAKFAYVDNCVVGAICCRLEPLEHDLTRQRTYIMTLGVLASHRKCRIGSQLLASMIAQSTRDGVDHIYLHVQTSNAVALAFYEAFGFHVTQTIRNYYKRIEPPDCYVLCKTLGQ